MHDAVDITLPIIGRCLRVTNAPDAVAALEQALPGWPMTIEAAAAPPPNAYLYRDVEGLWQGWLDEPEELALPSLAAVPCSLVGGLIQQHLTAEPALLGLHCGSVEIGGKLVIFPESSKAGKSTLTVAFAAAGYRVFGDDVLGVTPQGHGVAMGVAPRLRMPMPSSFSAEFRAYAQRHAGPTDEHYQFVIPAPGRLAHYDQRCPIGAIVLLERCASISEPEVVQLAASEGLLQLLCQNFAHSDTPDSALLERLLPITQGVPCLLLRYSEPLAGARYLAQALQAPPLTKAASLLSASPPNVGTAQIDPQGLWRPCQAVNAYPLEEELFLIHTPTGNIHRLNASGSAAWQLLQQEPLSVQVVADVMALHFNISAANAAQDITRLFATLAQAGLIEPYPTPTETAQ